MKTRLHTVELVTGGTADQLDQVAGVMFTGKGFRLRVSVDQEGAVIVRSLDGPLEIRPEYSNVVKLKGLAR